MMTRESLAAVIGSPTMVRALDNIILDYAFIDRKIALQILVKLLPVYMIRWNTNNIPVYVALSQIHHATFDILFEMWYVTEFPMPPRYVADWDEVLEMSADLIPTNIDEIDSISNNKLAYALSLELEYNGQNACPKLVKMINEDIDNILAGEKLFKTRAINIPWPPTIEDLGKTYSGKMRDRERSISPNYHDNYIKF